MKEIKLPIYSLNEEIKEERKQKYFKTLKKMFPKAKGLTDELYAEIKLELENNNKDILILLMENSVYHVLDAVADIYAKYDIEEVVSLDEGISNVLCHYNEKLNRFETLPRLPIEYTYSTIHYYTYLILARSYNKEIVKKGEEDILSPQEMIKKIDEQKQDNSLTQMPYELGFIQDLKRVTKKLLPREKELLIKRYGIETGKERTIQDLADEYGLTKGRVDQIIQNALKKLRANEKTPLLKDYNLRDMGL